MELNFYFNMMSQEGPEMKTLQEFKNYSQAIMKIVELSDENKNIKEMKQQLENKITELTQSDIGQLNY